MISFPTFFLFLYLKNSAVKQSSRTKAKEQRRGDWNSRFDSPESGALPLSQKNVYSGVLFHFNLKIMRADFSFRICVGAAISLNFDGFSILTRVSEIRLCAFFRFFPPSKKKNPDFNVKHFILDLVWNFLY